MFGHTARHRGVRASSAAVLPTTAAPECALTRYFKYSGGSEVSIQRPQRVHEALCANLTATHPSAEVTCLLLQQARLQLLSVFVRMHAVARDVCKTGRGKARKGRATEVQ